MSERSTLSILAEELASAFDPLRDALSSPQKFTSFMLELGWDLTEIPDPLKNLDGPLQNIANIIQAGEIDITNAPSLISAIGSLITAIRQIQIQPNNLFPPSVDADEFKSKLPEQLINALIFDYFKNYQPRWGELLTTLGILQMQEIEALGKRPSFIKKDIAWQNIAKLLSDPFPELQNAYQWGSQDFKAEILLENAANLADSWGIENYLDRLDDKIRDHLTGGIADLDSLYYWTLRIPLLGEDLSEEKLDLGISLFMLPPKGNDKPGFSILSYGSGEFNEEIELSDNIFLKIRGGMDLTGSIGILFRPGQNVQVLADLVSSGTTTPSNSISFAVENKGTAGSKIFLIGSEGQSRLEVGTISLESGVQIDSKGQNDAYAEFKFKDASIIIKPGSGEIDSFLSSLLPKDGFSFDFGIVLGISSSRGFYFGGSCGLEISLSVHKAVGPIEINGAKLAIRPEGGIIPFDIGTIIKGEFGPVKATVEDFGLRVNFSFPAGFSGNLGPLDVSLAFKPPEGIGVSIDAGPISGGGFIKYDRTNSRYSGALQLKIYEISVSAIGILDTRLPGGAQGYSFIILIFGEFAPIQLGLGFTLSGVGGLAGIHRTVMVEVLQQGIKSHVLDNILFPKDPIANAPKIISDISTVFPPASGKYVFGPMAIIGWGTPNIIRAELAIIIELPDPIRLLILGQISAVLPSEDLPLMELHIDVVGVIDFTNKRLAIDSTLHDSRILTFSISGDMALRLDWGDIPNFALSIGGFNPHFQPPPGFPALQRLTLAIGWGPSELKFQAYFAITSNTVQFGAQVDMYVQEGIFNIKGTLGIDALIIFKPFYFIVDFRAGVALRLWSMNLLGVTLDGQLSGPTPWRARGEACVSVLFWDVCVDFDLTWGAERHEELPQTDPWPLLQKAIKDERNWSANPASMAFRVVSLSPPIKEATEVIVDPIGSVSFHQKILPLNRRLTKFGETKPIGPDRYNLDSVKIGPKGKEDEVTPEILLDFFAPAQFEEMSDSEKLSRPAFVKMDAGITLESNSVDAGDRFTETRIDYETHIVIDRGIAEKQDEKYELMQTHQLSMILNGAASRSPLRNSGFEKFANRERDKVKFEDEGYVVVSTENLLIVDVGKGMSPMTKDAAYQNLYDYLDDHPQAKGTLQVVPMAEAST